MYDAVQMARIRAVSAAAQHEESAEELSSANYHPCCPIIVICRSIHPQPHSTDTFHHHHHLLLLLPFPQAGTLELSS